MTGVKRSSLRWLGTTSLLFAVAVMLSGCATIGARAPVITTSGTTVAFAGDVPLVTPVIDANDKTVTFAADWDHIHGQRCSRADTRTTVQQTAKSVSITVRGYVVPPARFELAPLPPEGDRTA